MAWRSAGPGQALVVLARGQGAGGMRSSFATLNVFHDGQSFPVTAPVTVAVGEGGASSSRQTLRFVFRLPASAAGWRIERMVLRWRGTEVELPPPAPRSEEVSEVDSVREAEEKAEEGGFEPVEDESPPVQTVSARYGPEVVQAEEALALLHEQIVTAKLELAQIHAELAQVRLEYEEAAMETEYAQRERDRAQQWLLDVTAELEDVESQLAGCRGELNRASRELAARLAAARPEPQDAEPLPVETEIRVASPMPEPAPRNGDGRAGAERDLNAALTDLRGRLERVLSEPRPVWRDEDPVPVEEAPVEEAPIEEAPIEEAPIEEGRVEIPDESLEVVGEPATEPADDMEVFAEDSVDARDEGSAPPVPASLPGATDRDDRESSWFAAALRRLAHEDREAAGQLLVSLLPAQSIATPRSFRYDLVVRDDAVYGVDAHPLDTRVEQLEVPRPMDQTDAWIMGALGQLGDLIAHGKSSFLRLFNRHGLKVKGQRARLDDLLALATAPLRLRDLCAVGAPVPPHLLLQMIVSSIDQSWVDERPLTIRLDPREDGMRVCSLRIRGGSPMVLGTESTAAADFGEVTTIAEGSARSLMRLLAGLPSPEDDQAKVRGPMEPVEMLQGWVRRLELSSM